LLIHLTGYFNADGQGKPFFNNQEIRVGDLQADFLGHRSHETSF